MNDLESTQQMRDLSRQMGDLESSASKGVATKAVILYRWKEDARGNRTMLDSIVAINSPTVIWSPQNKLLYMGVQYENAADIMLYRFFGSDRPKKVAQDGLGIVAGIDRCDGHVVTCSGPIQVIYELTHEQSIQLERISEILPCEIQQREIQQRYLGQQKAGGTGGSLT